MQGLILKEAHVAGGHYGGQATAWKVLRVGLWWPMFHNDAADNARSCDVCLHISKQSWLDEMLLVV